MKKYNVLGIGNAVVDVISQSSDMFLEKMNIEKGIMQLVDRDRGELLYNSMDNRKQAPGGSVANTIAGIGALGLKTGFIGKVGNDELGVFYRDTMEENGTDFVNNLSDPQVYKFTLFTYSLTAFGALYFLVFIKSLLL